MIILRPLANFSGNGVLRGTITALDDAEQPLGWENYGNWSDRAFLEKSAGQLAAATGIDLDRARMLLTTAVREARILAGIPTTDDLTAAPQHQLPVIDVSRRYLRDIAADAWRVIQEANSVTPQFFSLGNLLCDLVVSEQGAFPRVLALASLRNRLDRLADFISIDKDGEEHPSRPKRDLLEDLLAQDSPPVPVLRGVVHGPVCRTDGSVALQPGYDPDTGLFLDLGELRMPTLPDAPTGDQVIRAGQFLLEELLGDFPFASASDRCHAVAMILTPLIRPLISGPTPLYLVEAPSPGSGKDLLADCVALIATGTLPSAMTEGRDDDEWRKRITAKLITSPDIVLIDNVKRPLDSGALSAALERPIWEDRHLGLSRMVAVPVRCLWLCTANNPSLSQELARRTVRVRIDPRVEAPWERGSFRHTDLKQWVRSHRAELLWAALILVRYWLSRGSPRGQQPMGSYESWAATLGGILQSAEIPGFLGNRHEIYQQVQSQTEVISALLWAWWQAYGDQRVEVSNIFDLARRHKLLTELRAGRTDHGARVALGRLLSDLRDRVIGSFRIRQLGLGHGGTMGYQLQEFISNDFGAGENSPDSPIPPEAKAEVGETGDIGEFFSDPISIDSGSSTDRCAECRQPVPAPEIYLYTSSGAVLCHICGPEFIHES